MSHFCCKPLPLPACPHPQNSLSQASSRRDFDLLWLSSADKTVKLWKVSERDKRPEGYNLKDEEGRLRDPATITTLRVGPLPIFARLSAPLAPRVRRRAPGSPGAGRCCRAPP